MPKRTDIKKILVIGSGPIVIGQAAEFDYAGTQACLSLKEEGYEVILVNSNPATIMTDRKIADKIYMEPLDIANVSRIIRFERPCAILPTLGGQTGLNLSVELAKKGILEECGVQILGTSFECIEEAEDRDLFKELCIRIGEPVLESYTANTSDEALEYAQKIGYPVILRPAFTLGGTGGGFAYNDEELIKISKNALKLSPATQVLIEKSIKGYKEVEYEVMRDKNDTAIVICNMENIDPVGIHTGDSMVVCPSQTLTNKEYQMLRTSALKIVRELKIEGGCNVQFALDPFSMQYFLIEVNPRVSRSSALASKASGYPIARVSAKIAIGLRLDEIEISNTKAAFEPALDYVVSKIARFPFDKFANANNKLSTQMKATGEVMSIGRNMEDSLLKAVRGLETGVNHIFKKESESLDTETLLENIKTGTDNRLFEIAALLRKKVAINLIYNNTLIDMFFLDKIQNIINFEEEIKANKKDLTILKKAKSLGFSDEFIASIWDMTKIEVYKLRKENNITPVYKMIDTCASEFDSYVPYFYASYEDHDENIISKNKKVLVIGSGPIRIGQGVEFDYSTVHAVFALKEMGYEAIVINNNPETVSTDYQMSDKLYFEPLCIEDVMSVIDAENPDGVIVTLGGQTAINLCEDLTNLGVKIVGTDFEGIENAENRDIFEQILNRVDIKRPIGEAVLNLEDGLKVANEIGYPVLVRPSYVLGGRGMEIVYSDKSLTKYLENSISKDNKHPILVDKYISGKEVEVDAICDGESVLIPGVMEHIEHTGVHSGDSISVYPPYTLSEKVINKIVDYTQRLGLELKIIGLFNIQFIVDSNEEVYVIEVNPRSSRSVPFLSKITNVQMANIATKCMLGMKLKDFGYKSGLLPNKKRYYVKAPTFSYSKIEGLDAVLSPEMKSTGEAIGYDYSLNRAFYKALKASNMKVLNYGTIFVTVANEDKELILEEVRKFYNLGFNIVATKGTSEFLKANNIKNKMLKKISEDSNEILDMIKKGLISYVINTTSRGNDKSNTDGYNIRKHAVMNNITVFTSINTIRVLLNVLEDITISVATIDED